MLDLVYEEPMCILVVVPSVSHIVRYLATSTRVFIKSLHLETFRTICVIHPSRVARACAGSRDPNTHACMHHAGSAGSRGIPESCMHAHAADSLIFLILPKMMVLASLFPLESIWVPDL